MSPGWRPPQTVGQLTTHHPSLISPQRTSHFDVLTQAMVDIHYKFHLQDKMARTMTDNDKNFVKTFMQFGTEVELLLDIPEAAADLDIEGIKDVNLDVDPKTGDVNKVEYISVDAIPDKSKNLGLSLPVHMKCTTYTFNLVASVDTNKALDSTLLKSTYRKAMSKAQWLWKLQSPSTVATDSILDTLKKRFVVPNSTR
ncbi:Hypothetical predicted protein [Octopus vulgaris]|uniref:Uncharacterized protein n=1 Tax=Octopus vulgaris TaxID=6645 RepID=A0AA36AX72_OCTVU|nr:Hypothetical predicted protein [Octopus vulgaris]